MAKPRKPSEMPKTGTARPDPKQQEKTNQKLLGKGLARKAGDALLSNAKKRQKALKEMQ